jgi:hypothetical protein
MYFVLFDLIEVEQNADAAFCYLLSLSLSLLHTHTHTFYMVSNVVFMQLSLPFNL